MNLSPIRQAILLAVFTSLLSSCGNFLKPHKISIQQGNIISSDLVNKLETGMSKRQVEYILGTPLIVDSLTQDQWFYLFTLEDGRTGARLEHHIKLSFNDQLLADITTDLPRGLDQHQAESNPAGQLAAEEGKKLDKQLPTEREDSRSEAGL